MSGAELLFARGKLGARPKATNHHRATSAPPAQMAAWRSLAAPLLAALVSSVAPLQASADPEGIGSKIKGFFTDATVPAPEEVLSAYFDAQKSGNFEAAYDLLSTADRAFRSKDEYRADEEKGISGALAQAMTYKVKSVKLDGLKAVITVENTHPDVTAIIGPILAMALSGVYALAALSLGQLCLKVNSSGLGLAEMACVSGGVRWFSVSDRPDWSALNAFSETVSVNVLRVVDMSARLYYIQRHENAGFCLHADVERDQCGRG